MAHLAGTGGGGGGGGGAFPYRSPHQGGNRPQQTKKVKSSKSKLQNMVVELDVAEADRGMLIGRNGSTVKALQTASGAKIWIPKSSERGPVVVSASQAECVLNACMLIVQSGSIGDSGFVAGRMRPSQGMAALEGSVLRVSRDNPLLFAQQAETGMQVYFLQCHVPVEDLECVVDDAKFAVGSHAEVLCAPPLLFVHGQSSDKVGELHAALKAALSSTATTRPNFEDGCGCVMYRMEGGQDANEHAQYLLLKLRGGGWTLPSTSQGPGEGAREAAARAVLESTGLAEGEQLAMEEAPLAMEEAPLQRSERTQEEAKWFVGRLGDGEEGVELGEGLERWEWSAQASALARLSLHLRPVLAAAHRRLRACAPPHSSPSGLNPAPPDTAGQQERGEAGEGLVRGP